MGKGDALIAADDHGARAWRLQHKAVDLLACSHLGRGEVAGKLPLVGPALAEGVVFRDRDRPWQRDQLREAAGAAGGHHALNNGRLCGPPGGHPVPGPDLGHVLHAAVLQQHHAGGKTRVVGVVVGRHGDGARGPAPGEGRRGRGKLDEDVLRIVPDGGELGTAVQLQPRVLEVGADLQAVGPGEGGQEVAAPAGVPFLPAVGLLHLPLYVRHEALHHLRLGGVVWEQQLDLAKNVLPLGLRHLQGRSLALLVACSRNPLLVVGDQVHGQQPCVLLSQSHVRGAALHDKGARGGGGDLLPPAGDAIKDSPHRRL
mmetsp:Transcript_17065/g.47641  ORF Transcript_17065/g.47641 Transcript_17065/m.47641 type:complete len:314 (-) Transcript_17065:1430-2371(-)